MNISLFSGNIKNVKSSEVISIETFLQRIQAGFWKKQTEAIRNESDSKKISTAKQKIPYATVSGIFNQRKDAGLVEYSGFLAIDIDHREEDLENVFSVLSQDPYTFSVFKSVSGRGVCVIVKTTSKANHLAHFLWAKDYYKSIADIYIDDACKDVSRARFVSYDPKCVINYQARTAGLIKPNKKVKAKTQLPSTDSQIDRLVSDIYNRGINLCESYEDWIKIGMSFASRMGESGRPHFNAVSSVSDKYDQEKTDKKYSNLIKTGSGRITISTFLYKCKEAGLSLYSNEEKKAISIAKTAKKMNSDVESAVHSAKIAGVSEKVSRDFAKVVFETNISLENQESIIYEISAFIKMNYFIEKNCISQIIELDGKDITDEDYNGIYLNAKCNISDRVSKADVRAIIESPLTESYNPIDRWLSKHSDLPHKPEIIDEFLNILPLKTPGAKWFIYHWMLGIPATFDGDVVRLVLILCGKQETGKTEFFRKLLPPELRVYYAENNLTDEAEIPLIMSSNLITMDDEFSGKSKRDAQKFKEMTSKKEFTFRPKYGRSVVTRRRLSLMAGTANETDILSDRTGNTRILPVEFNDPYDYKKYNDLDKNKLLIEFFREYKRGKSWKLSPNAKELLNCLNSDYEIEDYEMQIINIFTQHDSSAEPVTFARIKLHLELCTRREIRSSRKLGIALGKKFDRKSKRFDGIKHKCYMNVGFRYNDDVKPYYSDNQHSEENGFFE